MTFLFIALSLVTITLVLAWYRFAYAPYQLFKKLGIPHPPIIPFFGNTLQIQKQGFLESVHEWFSRYGKVFGMHIGATKTICVADPDILKEIMAKQFSKFTDKPSIGIFVKARGKYPKGIVAAGGEYWKRQRTIVSPTFTTRKLKAMVPLIERSCDSLIEKLKEVSKGNQSVEMWRIFGQFTMETILAAAFGRQVNVLKGEGDELTEAAAGMFSNTSAKFLTLMQCLYSQLPFLYTIIDLIIPYLKLTTAFNNLHTISLQLIQARRQSLEASKDKDFLQLLIEARADDNEELPSSSSKTLTDEEIVSLCVDFLLAGYETTSNCLAYTSYLLALNTDKQDKLCQMIEDYYQENPDATLYDTSENIEYIDWVISESLRMYPPAPRTLRQCTETCAINGLTIPKDAIVTIFIQELHYSTEYWNEPDVFRPERFSPEEKEGRHPLCYMPFGWGPRNCVGMRFALMEAKMALVSVLRKYKFHIAPDTEIPLKTTVGITQSPTNGIHLKLIEY